MNFNLANPNRVSAEGTQLSRFVLAIKSSCKAVYAHSDLLQQISDIPGLTVLGGIGPLVVEASPRAIGLVRNRLSDWCHIEEEVLFRPSTCAE